jgi:squalene-hopene/tetraprenyl-beta-curcumene cyclase
MIAAAVPRVAPAVALPALMAAVEVEHPTVANGVAYLATTRGEGGFWSEPFRIATGFPRVYGFRYHGYLKFFPLGSFAR